jgi:glycosyltransferase involved in cell wall biosynthesis
MERNDNIEFNLVGILDLDQKFMKFGNRSSKPLMDYLEMLSYLSRMDINLAPLEMNNIFTASKSELKVFEAALVAVPTIASATDSYAGCITDGVNGFLASSHKEWRDKLERLITDSRLRRTIAQQAEREFVDRYFIQNIVRQATDIYQRIIQDNKNIYEEQRYALQEE